MTYSELLDEMIDNLPDGTDTNGMFFRLCSYSRLIIKKETGSDKTYKGFLLKPLHKGGTWNIITLGKYKS